MTTRRALVICGLVRDPVGFAAYLRGVLALDRGDLRVILSTWDGEMVGYPEVAGLMAELGEVVEQVPPNLKLPGHMLHQTMALERGLALLDDDVFVLKTRPDICAVSDVREFLALLPEAVGPGRLGGPFGHRVLVVGLFGAQPLYINDILFAGMAGDLRRLCPLPFLYGVRFPRLAPEQWLWATALVPGNVVLPAYLSVNPGLLFSDDAGNAVLREVLSESALFARALAVMAILARDCLGFLHPDPQRGEVAAACAGRTLEALLWDRVGVAGVEHHPTACTNTFLSGGVLDAVHDGLIGSSPLGDRVQRALARYGEAGGADALRGDRAVVAREAEAFGGELAARLGMGREAAAPWRIAETGVGYAAELEAEVNRLRRVVDGLQVRLGAVGEVS